MSLRGYESTYKATLNTKRLSAMLDSFQLLQEDDHIFTPNNTITFCGNNNRSTVKQSFTTPDRSNQSRPKGPLKAPITSIYSAGNRSSMISAYSGVVQEGVEVSYVVKNDKQESPKRLPSPHIPKLPEVSTERNIIGIEEKPIIIDDEEDHGKGNKHENAIITIEENEKSVGRFNSKSSTVSNPLPLRSDPVTPQRKKFNSLRQSPSIKYNNGLAGICMGNTDRPINTTTNEFHSDISNQYSLNNTYYDSHVLSINVLPEDLDDDTISVSSSFIQPLSTTLGRANSGKEPVRSETNTYNPSIPPRNSNRPRSRIYIPECVQEEPITKNEEPHLFSYLNSHNSGSFHSAQDYENDIEYDPVNYNERPLPGTPSNRSISMQEDNDMSNEETNLTASEKYTDPKEVKPKSKRPELRSYDVDTLSQVLDVTKGTLVGSEFANLGIKIEEKRILEKLVDSLSRLAADMVIDPERYDEGLKRLDKATKALEGFSTTK